LPLNDAAARGDLMAVRALVLRETGGSGGGVSVNQKDTNGWQAIHEGR
jgi:hypothetical protein